VKTCGKAEFGIDVEVYATVKRCPVGGTLKSFDASQALKMPGVEKVVEVERMVGRFRFKGVTIIANSYWTTGLVQLQSRVVHWQTEK
jgi:isoquinoline 1-oxidoreductase beta subunit